jgi:Fe2+ transport system protein B
MNDLFSDISQNDSKNNLKHNSHQSNQDDSIQESPSQQEQNVSQINEQISNQDTMKDQQILNDQVFIHTPKIKITKEQKISAQTLTKSSMSLRIAPFIGYDSFFDTLTYMIQTVRDAGQSRFFLLV